MVIENTVLKNRERQKRFYYNHRDKILKSRRESYRKTTMKMNKITVTKEDLLTLLNTNREKHIAEYNDAMKGYRVEAVAAQQEVRDNIIKLQKQLNSAIKLFTKRVDESLEEAQTGGKIYRSLDKDMLYDAFSLDALIDEPMGNIPSKPKSYETEYDTAIGMVSMDVDVEVELTKQEYKQYVMDEWSWTSDFNTCVSGSTGSLTFTTGNIGVGTCNPTKSAYLTSAVNTISDYGNDCT